MGASGLSGGMNGSSIALLFLLSVLPYSLLRSDESHPGRAIYQKHCVSCHGEKGQGSEDYPDVDPLHGTRSLESLAGRIERTMPEDEEDLVVGEEAKLVAEYIYEAFYSESARNGNRIVQPDLTRLTGDQFLYSVSDLIAAFQGDENPAHPKEQGLKANYSLNNRSKAGQRDVKQQNFKRTEPRVRFDLGEGLPTPPDGVSIEEGMTGFHANWTGTLYAPETGEYEFTLRTRNGVRMFLNEHDHKKTPLLDGWVAPGNNIREVKARAFLIGGRRYPIFLQFFKQKEPLSFIELHWRPPNQRREIVPSKYLGAHWVPMRFSTARAMPADDRSQGYERGGTVSRVWLEAVNAVAYEAADWVIADLNRMAKTKDGQPERTAKVRAFAHQFTERAFRRPLSADEKKTQVDIHFAEGRSEEDAVRRVVLNALTSPQFLYPQIANPDPDTSFAKASALALSLWDSLPDGRLWKTARSNQLKTEQQQRKKAQQMMADGRAHLKLTKFFHEWLEIEAHSEVAKDESLFPAFDESVFYDLRTSLMLFVEDTVQSPSSSFQDLLLSEEVYLNKQLGDVYGLGKLPWHFVKKRMPGTKRAGVITHPFMLTALAYHDDTSPIHRGVFLTRNIVGLPLKPPPEAIEFTGHDFPDDLTMREKVTEITRSKSCMACHSMINPLGFSLESFDAIGAFRETLKDSVAVNDDSVLALDDGTTVSISEPRDVARYAAESPQAHRAFVRQLFHHVVKQPLDAYGRDNQEQLLASFTESGFHIRDLYVQIALSSLNPNQVP